MISEKLVSFPQDCVVEEIRQRREGTIQTGFPSGPPVSVLKYERQVAAGSFTDARIAQQQGLVVQRETGLEGIGVSQRDQAAQGQHGPIRYS